MFTFLTFVQALVAAALVVVILVQRSEGGGLGVGGSPAGLMSARGAADFLTRLTAILATLFVALSITLAALAVEGGSGKSIDTSLDRSTTAPLPAPVANPLAPPAAAPSAAPASPAASGAAPAADPLAPAPKQ